MKRSTFNVDLLKNVSSQKEIKELLIQIKSGTQKLSCNAAEPTALVVSALKSKIKKSLYVVVEGGAEAQSLARMCVSLLGVSVYLINKPLNDGDVPGFFSEDKYQFEVSCGALLKGERGLYIISKQSLSRRLRGAPRSVNDEIAISVEKETSQKETTERLASWGYFKADHCRGQGTFSVRGGILDVFPKHMAHPVRIEFFNNKVESIRLFDIDTQLSVSARKNINIPEPVGFLSTTRGTKISDILERRKGLLYITNALEAATSSRGFAFYSEPLERVRVSNKEAVLRGLFKRFGSIYVCCYGDESFFSDIKPIEAEFECGFVFPSFRIACLVFSGLKSGVPHVAKKLPTNVSSKKITGLSGLLWGDLLVHQDYGIGKYCGLEQIVVNKKKEENIKIEYLNGAFVYVPVDRFNLVHKYVGSGPKKPRLSSLGTAGWQKQKLLTKKSTDKVVGDLIELYASRSKPRGFVYNPDIEILSALTKSFPYKETPDQARAIKEVLGDLRKAQPMDRLLYGDVGFGKTEVALRAIVAVVSSGRCAFFLAPTTVLSDQHFITCKNRLDPLGINVELLSRFRTKKDQTKILGDLKNKKIDVVIGTHRLLTGDVSVNNLGLLVVDEEHRFGVKNKEKIKTLKAGVDVLTLTATPIPRTLQQSLVGLKDTSKIETPPTSRLPIKTYVKFFEWGSISKIIKTELRRGGQVYFVHNDIAGLSFYKEKLVSLFPKNKVVVAHSKVSSYSLEKAVLAFFKGEADILVCTSIIESGLDIPNANTIIINQAQNFGLSQLYQIRGRVGRGNRQAHCYLCLPKNHVLSPNAFQRLKSIEFNTSLGSGYTIAMKDLELRGSGNLFGLEQSGQVARVGLSLYNKILVESVRKAQGKQPRVKACFPRVVFDGDAFFESTYIPLVEDRLYYYQSISETKKQKDLLAIKKEIVDRFGKLPAPAINVFVLSEVQRSFSFLKPKKINIKKDCVSVLFSALPKTHSPSSFARVVGQLSKKSGFSLQTRSDGGGSFSLSFQGASIDSSLSLALLLESLFSKPLSK